MQSLSRNFRSTWTSTLICLQSSNSRWGIQI